MTDQLCREVEETVVVGQVALIMNRPVEPERLIDEERNASPLLALLSATVAPEGEALVADPGRHHADAFFEQAEAAGWSLERIAADGLPSGEIVRLSRSTG